MESLARPFHRRKLSNASSSFSAKTAYDDVFSAAGGAQKSGAPAHSSRIEDYSEVFGGSRTSSIPILDLSAIDEAKVSADARSSMLDYSKIFGGVRDGDIAVSYQEMFSKPKGAKNFSDGARAPAKTFSHTDGSGRPNRYKEEAFQNEANQAFEGVKQFNMSYHKTSQRSDDGTNGATRIAQLRAVPAFTCFIGEDNPIRKTEGDKSIPLPKVDVTSPPKVSAYVTKKQTSDGIGKFGSQASGDRFCPIDKSFSANGPSTHPSKMASPSSVPANLTSDNSRPKRSMDPNFKVPKNDVSKAGPGYWSPSLSDEELDVNSAAAASAAALRKALEKAQASIRIAKEFMERKKDGPQRFSKPSSMDGLDFKNRREDKVTREASRTTEKNSKEINESVDSVFQVFTKSERDKARRSGKVAPDLKVREEIPIVKEVSRETKGNKLESAQDCEEPRLISELASRATCSTATLAFEHANGTNNVMLSVDSHECGRKEMEVGEEILEQLQGTGKKEDEEAQTLEDLEGKLDKSKTILEWEQHGYRVDTAQGVHEQEQNEKVIIAPKDEETEEKQKASIAQGKCEQELEPLRPNENEEFESLGVNSNNNEEGLHEAQDCMENAGNVEDIFEKAENKNSLEDVHEEEESEKKIQRICEQVEIQNRLQELYLSVDYEEACEAENIEKRQNDAHEGEDNEKSLDKIHEPEIDIERLNSPDGEESEERQEDNSAWEGKEKKLREPCEYAETEIIQRETEGYEKKEVNQEAVEETIYLDATSCEYVDTESIQKETEGSEKKEVNKEVVEETIYLDATSNSCKWDADESVSKMEEGHPHKQNDSNSIIEENERISDVTQSSCELKDDEDGWKAVEVALEVGEKEKCSSGGSVAGVAEHIEIEKQMKDERDSTIEEHGRISDVTQSSCEFKEDENGLEAVEAMHEVGEKERCSSGGSVVGVAEHIEIENQMKEESDSIIEEHERISDVTQSSCEFDEDDDGLEAVEAVHEVGEKERCSSGGSVAGVAEHIEIENQMKDESDSTIEEHERISDVTQSSCEFDEDEDGLEAVEAAHEVGEKERCSSCECKEDEDGLEAVEAAHEVGEKERCSSGGSVAGAAEHIEIKNQMKDGSEALHLDDNPANISLTGTSDGPRQTDQNGKESELISNLGSGIKISVCESVEGEKEVNEKIVSHPEEVKSNFETPHKRRQWFETRKEMEPSQPPMFGAARKRRQWFETGKEMDPSQPPSMFTGEEKMTRIDDEIKKRQIAEKNMENLNKTFSVEEMETKETEQKEVKTEKELLRKNDEANKRERERERDRMAVERAIREARERAFAEARERAERAAVEKATADARKRITAEAREKHAKASAATKSSVEKASQEAKLRAERAAVERATAEARERALEKALSQKATSGAREQSERYVAEKSSGVSRDNGMRQSFLSSGTQKLDETNGESAERRKAMLERHQRTMERAAKALAEKNRRDLLIQKEQAERNRFAETLDADVKRWSSGKEGNLRALLSTLQYVLGPNSGWQPVTLTEIVTTTAVKKAYRKATLHVHPDKLQQRGATIQQKYICEKVFDLLKAAWNRFNSEER